MDEAFKKWRDKGRHLPAILRGFHDQKDVFKTMHELTADYGPDSFRTRPSWSDGQIYVIDQFLWFMARHGYTLQRSRANQNFESLPDNIKAVKDRNEAAFSGFLASVNGKGK